MGLLGEVVPLRGNRATVTELPPNLDIATENFRDLLRRTLFPEQVLWITCHDLILRPEEKTFIRVRDWDATLAEARTVYADAVCKGYAIAIEAWAASDTCTYAEVWAVKDDSEAELLMMNSKFIKYSVPATKRVAIEVNAIRWAYLSWRYQRGEWCKTLPHFVERAVH